MNDQSASHENWNYILAASREAELESDGKAIWKTLASVKGRQSGDRSTSRFRQASPAQDGPKRSSGYSTIDRSSDFCSSLFLVEHLNQRKRIIDFHQCGSAKAVHDLLKEGIAAVSTCTAGPSPGQHPVSPFRSGA